MVSRPKTKLDAIEQTVVKEAVGIVKAAGFQQILAAGRQSRGFELVIGKTVIVVEPALPEGYCAMSLFGEHGFILGSEAFSSVTQLHKTVLWELYRLMTDQSSVSLTPGVAASLRQVTEDFTERAWPWFVAALKR